MQRLIVVLEDVHIARIPNPPFRAGDVVMAQGHLGSWEVVEPILLAGFRLYYGVSPGYTLPEAAAYLTQRLDTKVSLANVRDWNRAGLFPRAAQQSHVRGRGGKRWIVPLVDLDAFQRPKIGPPFKIGQTTV